jgi:hypothetical protein
LRDDNPGFQGDCLAGIDLREVARILQPLFPDLSIKELEGEVARVAVSEGCRFLVWDPAEAADRLKG